MNSYYKDTFLSYLHITRKYPSKNLRADTYKYNHQEYFRVEVLAGEYVIQAFVLMSESHCRDLDKFPFYRTYSQKNDYGYQTPPACYIAVFNHDSNEWEIHNSSDLRQEMISPALLDYKAASERFKNRLLYFGNKRLMKRVTVMSTVALVAIVLYFTAYILSINGWLSSAIIPFDVTVLSILVILAILLILPPIIPYIKVQYHGFSLEVNQD